MMENRKRPISFAVMLVCIAAAILIGGYRGLSGAEEAAAKAFENGVRNDGDSVAKRLSEMADGAANLVTVAKRADADNRLTGFVEDSKNLLKTVETPSKKYAAMTELIGYSQSLEKAIKDSDASETDKGFAYAALKSIESAQLRVEKIGYNEYVDEINARFTAFPANILKNLVGVKEAEYFR